jgi:DNA polymerase I-like protein with 3'-5' exonuclease and polymerase domains
MQLPFGFTVPQVQWTPPVVSRLPSWANAKRVSIDVETKDPDLKDLGPGNFRPDSHVVGIGVAIEDGESFYLPIRHEGGDNLDVEHVLDYMRDNARIFSGTLVGANLAYDLGFLERDDVFFRNVEWYRDVQNNAVLIYELFDRYGLNVLCERFGIPGKDETILNEFAKAYKVHPKKEIYKLPGRAAALYGAQDARLPLEVLRLQEKQIAEYDIKEICDLEAKVLPILVKMRRRGVRVDMQKVDQISAWALAQEGEALAKVKHLSGVEIRVGDVWKAEVMARPLEAMGYKYTMTRDKKPKPSITGDLLETCGEVGAALNRAREVNKLRTTFCARMYEYVVKDRVHPVFHQLRRTKDENAADGKDDKGARYGRFSCEHHNIQQEPVRDDEFGAWWRSVYVADSGGFWVCSDWSQQEPRWGVHFAELLGLRGAKEFADQYRANPRLDVHQALADISSMPRKIVKNFVNGRLYGMGDAKLCRSIKCETYWKPDAFGKMREYPGPEGQEKIDQFNRFVPWLQQLTREASKVAKERGFVWTWLRRRCNFPKDSQGNYDWVHKAFSRIGQGTAADQMKATLVEADKEGIPLQMAVHDEFDYTEYDPKRMRRLKELQMYTVRANVPMQVDQEVGANWGEIYKDGSDKAKEFLSRWETC